MGLPASRISYCRTMKQFLERHSCELNKSETKKPKGIHGPTSGIQNSARKARPTGYTLLSQLCAPRRFQPNRRFRHYFAIIEWTITPTCLSFVVALDHSILRKINFDLKILVLFNFLKHQLGLLLFSNILACPTAFVTCLTYGQVHIDIW